MLKAGTEFMKVYKDNNYFLQLYFLIAHEGTYQVAKYMDS